MAELSKGIFIGCLPAEVYIRVVGRGTFQNGQPLRRAALELVEKGAKRYFVDLGGCDGMDSTFLGVLAGIGLRLKQQNSGGHLNVLNVGRRNLELLQTLGLDRLFGVDSTGDFAAPAAVAWQRLPDSDIAQLQKPLDKNDTADLMLEAHNNLIQADGRNQAKFKDLTSFLRDRIEKSHAEPQSGAPPVRGA